MEQPMGKTLILMILFAFIRVHSRLKKGFGVQTFAVKKGFLLNRGLKMELTFEGDWEELKQGIEILGGEVGYEVGVEGLAVRVERRPGGIEVFWENGTAVIRWEEKIHFFRGLGLLVESLRTGDPVQIMEKPCFTMNGAMLDVSRNAVLKVDSIQKMLRKMALMGLNTLMLYMEDTYRIEAQPYFGYMRGRYSWWELAECDDYAARFGIEMIPCIQTLGHLKQFLKWEAAAGLRDTGEILLTGEERTYQFIEEMIRAVMAPFRSRRIHIGMDEAYEAGLGKYLGLHG